MKIQRREFLKRSALGVGGMMAAARLGAMAADSPAQPAKDAKFHDPFARVKLGQTKLSPTRVCIGTGMKGSARQSNQTRLGADEFQALLRGAYDRGVRMFDAADLYGSHPHIPVALKGVPREDYVISTKIWWRPGALPEAERPDADVVVPRFLKELQTDYIDLLLLHCVDSGKWPDQLRKQMDILSKFKEQGKIRALGVSCHSLAALEAAAAEPWVDSVHTRINPYGMSMDGPVEAVVAVLKKVHAAGKGVVGMKLIGEGRLRNDDEKRTESVKFVLGLGCVDVLNVGFEKMSEIDDFTARVRKVPVGAASIADANLTLCPAKFR